MNENIIEKTEIGYKCMMGMAVGRIVGFHEDGQWGEFNGKKWYSLLEWSTPHGSVFKVGSMKLQPITKEGDKRLSYFENQLSESGEELYRGRLNDSQ